MTRCTRRATTAIALLDGNQLHLARVGTTWESRAAQIPSDFRASVIAIDGPLLPEGADDRFHRACEAVFIRSPFSQPLQARAESLGIWIAIETCVYRGLRTVQSATYIVVGESQKRSLWWSHCGSL